MTIKSDDTQVNLEQARKFGRVSDDGHVFVIVEGEEYAVGQLPGASEEEALAYFARKFENVEAQVSLLESRVENNSPAQICKKVSPPSVRKLVCAIWWAITQACRSACPH